MKHENGNPAFPALNSLYEDQFGFPPEKTDRLTAHGSERKIFRMTGSNGDSAIGIFNENLNENEAFISFDKTFREGGLHVPIVYRASNDLKHYLLEDLGDVTLLDWINKNPDQYSLKIDLYKQVLDVLPEFQITSGKSINYRLCYQFKEFGEENLDFDLNYFVTRFLSRFAKSSIDESRLNENLKYLKCEILELPREYFLYRDFQARNIMLKDTELYFIDFQSGRRGFPLYDAASLLYDGRVTFQESEREELLEHYVENLKKYIQVDAEQMKVKYRYFAVIRILQALGAYGYLGIVKGKGEFVKSIPYALSNINFILSIKLNNSRLTYLRDLLEKIQNEQA